MVARTVRNDTIARAGGVLPIDCSQSRISQSSATLSAFEERREIPLLTQFFANQSKDLIRKDFETSHGQVLEGDKQRTNQLNHTSPRTAPQNMGV